MKALFGILYVGTAVIVAMAAKDMELTPAFGLAFLGCLGSAALLGCLYDEMKDKDR